MSSLVVEQVLYHGPDHIYSCVITIQISTGKIRLPCLPINSMLYRIKQSFME